MKCRLTIPETSMMSTEQVNLAMAVNRSMKYAKSLR